MDSRALMLPAEADMGWMPDAACTTVPGLPWTAESLCRVPWAVVQLMAETCAGCPVHEPCAQFVVDARVTAGYWAGRTRDEKQPSHVRRLSVVAAAERQAEGDAA